MAEQSTGKSTNPVVIVAIIAVVVIAAVFMWPSEKEDNQVKVPVAVQPKPVAVEPEVVPAPEPEEFMPAPMPEPVEIDPNAEVEPLELMETPEPEPEPVDLSDAAIISALNVIANNNMLSDMLITKDVLQRFVVSATNLADDDMAPNHRLFIAPQQNFRVYQQAQRLWVDPASYKRYTPYVDALESLDNERLLTLFERYQSDMDRIHEEISADDEGFASTLNAAINTLLDTPEVPVPVEVYSDSVMYKYKLERLENLTAPKKQLLRTGPDNMRRIKAKLREIKALLEDRGY